MTTPPAADAPRFPPGTWSALLDVLSRRGLHFGSVIDIGSADGQFILFLYELGFFRDSRLLNIDASEVYRDSLETMRKAIGAEYRLCAVGAAAGRMPWTRAAHPYWSSLRPPDDPYWTTIQNHVAEQATVDVRTLDDIVAELGLPGPYLLKLDIQGGEADALRGGAKALAQADLVIIETMMEDFDGLYRQIVDAGFVLFDVTYVNRRYDQTLGWFYPVFLNRRRASLIDHRYWLASEDAEIVASQASHRQRMLQLIDESLARLRTGGIISG